MQIVKQEYLTLVDKAVNANKQYFIQVRRMTLNKFEVQASYGRIRQGPKDAKIKGFYNEVQAVNEFHKIVSQKRKKGYERTTPPRPHYAPDWFDCDLGGDPASAKFRTPEQAAKEKAASALPDRSDAAWNF